MAITRRQKTPPGPPEAYAEAVPARPTVRLGGIEPSTPQPGPGHRPGGYDTTINGGTFGDPANDPKWVDTGEGEGVERYEVGYGKPPTHTRFEKGRSGNPSGRPRRPESFGEHMDRALRRQRRVDIGGRIVELSMKEVLANKLVEKAVAGDMRAFDRLKGYLDLPPEEMRPQRGGRMVTVEVTEEEIERIEAIAEEHGIYYDERGRQLNGNGFRG